MNWTKKELQAYILIWCANADYMEDEEEKELILSKVDQNTSDKLHREFNKDNDYQRIEKINAALEALNYSKSGRNEIISEMKEMFEADGTFDSVEQSLLVGLKRIFN